MSDQLPPKQGQTFIEKKNMRGLKQWLKKPSPTWRKVIFATVIIVITVIAIMVFLDYRERQRLEQQALEEEKAAVLQEAEKLVYLGNTEEANQRYQSLVEKDQSKEWRAEIYQNKSSVCQSFQQVECSLEAWIERGDYIEKDYKYYFVLAKLYRMNLDEENYELYIQKTRETIPDKSTLSEEDTTIINEIEAYINEVAQ